MVYFIIGAIVGGAVVFTTMCFLAIGKGADKQKYSVKPKNEESADTDS